MSRSRKGDLFMLGLDIVFLLSIVLIFWKLSGAFTTQNPQEGVGTRQTAVLNTYAVSEQMLLYLDETAKFSSFEALDAMTANGNTNPVNRDCGAYAGYTLWASGGADCFPKKQDQPGNAKDTFKTYMDAALVRNLKYPGMPNVIHYTYDIDTTNGFVVRGTTADRLRLPIISAKGNSQSAITALLQRDNLIANQQGAFKPDPTIDKVTITVIPSPNYRKRDVGVSYIIIHTVPGASAAIAQYTTGALSSVHYLIDEQGHITQLVSEDQAAIHMPVCDATTPCAIHGAQLGKDAIEQQSIGIALVNAGSSPAEKDGTCKNKDTTELLSRVAWCGIDDYYNGVSATCAGDAYTTKCWAKYDQKQLDALKALVADIMSRRGIKPADIRLEEQIRTASESPGPAMHEQGTTEKDLFAALLVPKQNPADFVGPPAPVTTQAQAAPIGDAAIALQWPVKSTVITSCFGDRDAMGRNYHYGIDLRAATGDPVFAVADGTVFETPQVCTTSACGESGTNILLMHSKTFFTRYSHLSSISPMIVMGATVHKGDIIGQTGNTGSSEAPHLDFKVYTGSPRDVKNTVNPLCVFSDDILQGKTASADATSCQKYKGLSHNDPQLAKECQGVDTHTTIPPCYVNTQSINMKGNDKVTKTLDRLTAIKSLDGKGTLVDEIRAAAIEFKLPDYRLLVAQIAQESVGVQDVVTFDGGVGISQFTDIKVSRNYFDGIADPSKILDAPCRQSKTCKRGDYPSNDPRLDPHASVRAQAKMMADIIGHYTNNDKVQFGLAEYNTGQTNMNKAISKAMAVTDKQKSDLTFVDISPYLPKITQDYVPTIMANYASIGGSAGNLYADQTCDQVTVKEMGAYLFAPAFTVNAPNLLTSLDRTSDFAKQAYAACDGKNGIDNRACFQDQITKFSTPDLAVISCDDENVSIIESLSEAIRDCRDNLQSGCACVWKPPMKFNGGNKITIDAYDDPGVKVSVDDVPIAQGDANLLPQGTLNVRYSADTSTAPKMNTVHYTFKYTGGTFTDGTMKIGTDPDILAGGIVLYKPDDDISWMPDGKNPVACGEYKTMQRVCVGLKQPLYSISKGTFKNPVIRFALDLQDDVKPASVTDLTIDSPPLDSTGGAGGVLGAVTGGAGSAAAGAAAASALDQNVQLSFTASASDDASYYMVRCAKSTDKFGDSFDFSYGRDGNPVNGVDKKIAGKISVTLKDCGGKPVALAGQCVTNVEGVNVVNPANCYKVNVTTVDISGNEDASVVYDQAVAGQQLVAGGTTGTVGTASSS